MRRSKKRTEVRNSAPQSIGEIFEAFLKETGLGITCREWDVAESWERVAGERVARVTESVKTEGGVLYVKVTSAPWRQELSYMKDMLKESIVRETGCKTIKDIVFL